MNAVVRSGERFETMGESDLDEVLEIERSVYEYPWTRGNFSDSIHAGYSCWMYRWQSAALGYCILLIAAGESHLLNLSIAPAFQRQGHGRRLLAHALRVSAKRSARLLFLEVRPSNEAARALYASSGFSQVGVRRNYYPAVTGREDALVLVRNLI